MCLMVDVFDVYLHVCVSAAYPVSCLEPMDTIFVKSVKENSPAQQAGLCTGDRLVKVNGESILGKTYSQVIALIQNSENILELSIMPKDEDVLQLVSAYSQDAYLTGNEPYVGEAQNLPEPPPVCYSSIRPCSAAPQPSQDHLRPLDNRPGPAPSPLDNHPTVAATSTSGRTRGPEDDSSHFVPSGWHRGHSVSAVRALDFHFANHSAAIASATLPPPRKSSLPACAHMDELCHRALSDWYYSQTADHMTSRHRSVSQDHLAELGAGSALSPGSTAPPATSAKQHKRETVLYHNLAAAASHDSHWLRDWGGVMGPGSRSCSESLLAAYAEYEQNYGRSVEALARASALVSPHCEQSSKEQKASGGHQNSSSIRTSSMVPPRGKQPDHRVSEPQHRRGQEDVLMGYKSYSPSFCHKADHLLRQAQSFRGPHLTWSPSPANSEWGVVSQPESSPALPVSEAEKSRPGEETEVVSLTSLKQEVVLRQKPLSGRRTPIHALRHTYYASPVESPEPPSLAASPGSPGMLSPVSGSSTLNRKANGGLAQQAYESLSSIPFIGSIKGRRSSYLLAVTTERSRSCDEGLNNFREESRVFAKLPKRVKSFFTDGSLEALRAQEEARSKRHSTSELGTITFSDVRKEGWLHYKQILTEKGKKVGGGMRPWKRVFSVLRSHSLFLYKDKREAVLHGAGAGPNQDEHPPISIGGCLTDIAYSGTKRKNALRLTTQDFCEYLLQAEDREDMLAWIRVIRENSKVDSEEIGFSRQALINKKLNDYRKQSPMGSKPDSSPRAHHMMPPFLLTKTDSTSGSRVSRSDDSKTLWSINIKKKAKKTGSPKAFGVRLEECQPAVNHKFVPLVVEMCCGVVEASGLEYTGIYRVPGNNAMVSNLQEHLNKGLDMNSAEERWQDLNVISSLLKSFFRKLPEPLFTDDKYSDFIDANRMEDADERLKTMKKLIHGLPDHYYHTLRFLVSHLKKVADHSEKNKMEPRNLALVFGPTLVRTSEDNMTDMVTHMPDRYKIVETLILHFDWFFADGELGKEEQAPDDKQDDQPVPNIDHLLPNIGRPGMPGEASDSITSDSLKSKSLGSKKDLNARDFLPSIISAVTRKRKKRPSSRLAGSSTDEDSEHEPEEEEEEGGGEEEAVKRERTIPNTEKGKAMQVKETIEGKEPGRDEAEEGHGMKDLKNRQNERTTSCRASPQRRPNSFLYSHLQHSRPPVLTGPSSHLRSSNLSRGCPAPTWLAPTGIPNLYRACGVHGAQQPERKQPVLHRKSRGGRTRSVSMNLDLELGRSETSIRGWRGEKTEVIRVVEGAQCGRVSEPQGFPLSPASIQQTDPFPHFAPRLVPASSGWTDQSAAGSSAVVLRRSAVNPRDRTGAWRRHTVVV
ncbi:hypothetical protein LDENG_00239020 [Lucifuga dentata]|nr:hypothetical protein LDENG_00239020 [Lucifuga dentata]